MENQENKKILMIEDDLPLQQALEKLLTISGYEVVCAGSCAQGLQLLAEKEWSLILCDYKLPDETGLDFLGDMRCRGMSYPFIMMTAFGDVDLAVSAMKHGANDFLMKPFAAERLLKVIEEVTKHQRIITRADDSNHDVLLSSGNPTVSRLMDNCSKIAAVDSSVLLVGESGVGKEIVARYLHTHSKRKNNDFVAINCAALPTALLESELFGHEKGAFTGATRDRMGLFEISSDGTLFLDEIAELPLDQQVKLLRAIQEKSIKRVGGSKVIKASPRIISATNQNIVEAIKRGKLREDLYYRLAVLEIEIPPLRERPEDIIPLADLFLQQHYNKSGKRMLLSDKAMELMRAFNWPGNIRQLKHSIERAVLLAERVVSAEDLGVRLQEGINDLHVAKQTLSEIVKEVVSRTERAKIVDAIELSQGNKAAAARALGISYKTMLAKIKEYNLCREGDAHLQGYDEKL